MIGDNLRSRIVAKKTRLVLVAACLLGLLAGTLSLALTERSSVQSIEQIRAKAEAGNAEAQETLGLAYLNGTHGLLKDYEQAVRWHQKAADQDLPSAINQLGIFFEEGKGVPKSEEKAFSLYLRAAEAGFPSAQGNVGRLYQLGKGVTQDWPKAILWYEKAAQNGSPEAQHNLGTFFLEGTGVPQNYEVAAEWFGKAAEQGFAGSEANLATMYLNGQGVVRDVAKAGELYKRAAIHGEASAQSFLLDAKRQCDAASQSITENDVPSCFLSAGAGDSISQFIVGTLFDSGTYVERDDDAAISWFEKAAFQNDPMSQWMLMMKYGKGPSEDLVRSYAWLKVVKLNEEVKNNSITRERIGHLSELQKFYEQKLTPEEMETSNQLAREYANRITSELK